MSKTLEESFVEIREMNSKYSIQVLELKALLKEACELIALDRSRYLAFDIFLDKPEIQKIMKGGE